MVKKKISIILLMLLSQSVFADVALLPSIDEDENQEETLSKTFKVEGYQDQEYTYGTVTVTNDNKITGYVYLKTTVVNEVIIQEQKIPKIKPNLTGEVIVDGQDYYFVPKETIKKEKITDSKLKAVAIYGRMKNDQITAYDFNGNLYQLKVKP